MWSCNARMNGSALAPFFQPICRVRSEFTDNDFEIAPVWAAIPNVGSSICGTAAAATASAAAFTRDV